MLLIGFHSTTDEKHKLIKAGAKKKKEYKDCFIHDDIRPFSELDDAAKDIDWKLVNRTYTRYNETRMIAGFVHYSYTSHRKFLISSEGRYLERG